MKIITISLVFCFSLLFATNSLATYQFNIRDYGAIGDGKNKDTQAIQNAVNACFESGGGEVLVPSGNYLTGSVQLKSNVHVRLLAGATVVASADEVDFNQNYEAVFYAEGAESVAISGMGTIRGLGNHVRGRRYGAPTEVDYARVYSLRFINCKNLKLHHFKIENSSRFTILLEKCENILIDGITILNNIKYINADGIDPSYCKNLHITNCHIETGDDSIVLKEGGENIVVDNCTLVSATSGLKFGTGTESRFNQVHFNNITIKAPTGIGLFMKDGGTIENVTFSNISIESFRPEDLNRVITPISIDIEQRNANSPVGFIRDISFNGIHIRSGSGILIQGMPDRPVENLYFNNITFRADWLDNHLERKKPVGGDRTTRDYRDTLFIQQPTWMAVAYVNGLNVSNYRVFDKQDLNSERRSAIGVWESHDIYINGKEIKSKSLKYLSK